MIKIARFLFVATVAALTLFSCKKDKEPTDNTPAISYTFTASSVADLKADLKIAASAAVPADVAVALSLDPSSTLKAANISFPATLTIKKGQKEATGQAVINPDGLEAGNYEAKITATVDGKAAGQPATIAFEVKKIEPEPEPEPEPESLITIDGDLSDWAEIEAVENGNHTFKFAMDDKKAYFYSFRAADETYPDLWGSSEGYVYFAFDLDKDLTTGAHTLWGNGPFEYVGVIWPYGGSAEAPAINKKPESACNSSAAAIKSIACDGVIDDSGVTLEFSINLADLPTLPSNPAEAPFIIYSWGSTNLAKVEYHVGEPQPEPESIIKIDGDMSDWAEIEGVTEGTHTFKAISDEKYIYLYSMRHNEGRYGAIWNGTGYIYFGFDTDNDAETGDGEKADWGTGKWETLILTFPYAGTEEAPEIADTMGSDWWILPSAFSINNLTFKGIVTEEGAEIEFRIPRADMGEIPDSEITLNAWGNKDLSRAILHITL